MDSVRTAELRNALEAKQEEIRRELVGLGVLHRGLLQRKECSCCTGGRCIVADTLERGTEMLSDSPMPPAMGNC